MNIEDVKVGTRVVCLNDSSGVIPKGAFGTIIQDDDDCPSVSWEKRFSKEQYNHMGYYNVYALMLNKIEKVSESFVPEKEIAKLTVSVSVEDKEEIAKDILKIVLNDLNVIISDAIYSLSNDSLSNDSLSNDSLSNDSLSNDNEEVKEPVDVPTVASNVDFSDEKLQSMFEEVMKDVTKEYLRDSINTLNKTAFGI